MSETDEKKQGASTSVEAEARSRKLLIICVSALVMVIILMLVLAVLLATANGRNDDLEEELQLAQQKNEELASNYSLLNNETVQLRRDKAQLQWDLDEQRRLNRDLQATIRTLEATVKAQAIELSSLRTTNTWLWIGGGTSFSLALGAGAYSYYEWKQLSDLKAQLSVMTSKYEHFKQYFETSWDWATEDLLLWYKGYRVNYNVIYNSSLGFTREEFIKHVTGVNQTWTIITTDADYKLVGVLYAPWVNTTGYIKDIKAFTMAVNRVVGSDIKSEHSDYAAYVSPDIFVQFGEGEIVIYNNNPHSCPNLFLVRTSVFPLLLI